MSKAAGKGKGKGKGVMVPMPKMKSLMQKHQKVLMKASAKAAPAAPKSASSKAPSMLGASAKAKPVGATARRFIVSRVFSKAAAVANSSQVTMFAGKAFATPPWRTGAKIVAPKAKGMAKPKDPEEEDYDPFAEEPAPHVAMEKIFRKAARRAAAAAGKLDSVEWRPEGGVKPPPKRKVAPWRLKVAAAIAAAPEAKAAAPAVPKTAWGWLKRPGGSNKMSTGAALAEEYFSKTQDSQPAAKKQKLETSSRGFVKELLDKAPSTLQTCRSLLLFLDKKLEGAVPEKPAVGGPEALKKRLEAQAESAGRLAGIRTPGGWDARAKRVLDITATASSAPGEAALAAMQEALEKEANELEAKLKESGDSLEAVTKERQAWAKDTLRRDWLAWCSKLLNAREAKLLAEVEADKEDGEATAPAMLMTAVDILEALLAGTTA
eukprot:gb/GFBE01028509.1/.p1 GENE.gb/GFBE01028509.1/~~gb/GFBE01028509.1/.p1  ORF type:complete len:435 (+),score=150.54 gb/GFBE01028509.1/:1-1305(+)